jgi:hypothetical protein
MAKRYKRAGSRSTARPRKGMKVSKIKSLTNDAAAYKAGYQDSAWIATCEKIMRRSGKLSRSKYPNLLKRIERVCEG